MANDIDITITSQADDSGFRKARKSTEDYKESTEGLIEKADESEQRITGLNDSIQGTAAIMQGPGKVGIEAYIQGWADLASGFANLIIPAIRKGIEWVKNLSVEQVKAAAKTVASWIAMGTQATINGLKMAAAWLLALGPIPLIIAGIAAVGAAFFVAWKKSETFRNIVKDIGGWFVQLWNWISAGLHWIGDAAKAFWDAVSKFAPFKLVVYVIATELKIIKEVGGFVIGVIKGIGQAAGGAAAAVWNFARGLIAAATGAKDLAPLLPAVLAGLPAGNAGSGGGAKPGAQKGAGFAGGGIVGGGRTRVAEYGGEWLDLPPGARVRSNADTRAMAYAGGAGYLEIRVTDDGSAFGRLVSDALRKAIRFQGGGNAQRYLGFS